MISWFESPPPIVDDARLEDADAMAEIHAASFHRGWTPAEFEALIASDSVTAVVARAGGRLGRRPVLGFAIARRGADEAELLAIVVSPPHRGKGIGRRLIEEATRRLYYDRVRTIFLEVDEGNVAALALYRRLGYVEVGRRGNYYEATGGGRTNALVMRADLT